MLGDAVELTWNRKDLQSLKSVVTTFCTRREVAVQAGGCYGVFAQYLAREFGSVYVFEPDPKLFRALVSNVEAVNVVLLQAALGYKRQLVGTELVRRPDKPLSLHPGMTRTAPGGRIPTLRVDDLGLPHCDLIYLDVEGDELYALEGACATIMEHFPIVVCEINAAIEQRGLKRADVFHYLSDLGYNPTAHFRSDVVFTHAKYGAGNDHDRR